jgi:hypothetical protein
LKYSPLKEFFREYNSDVTLDKEIFALIKEQGFNPDGTFKKDVIDPKSGNTMAHLIFRYGGPELVKAYTMHNPDGTILDKDGYTASDRLMERSPTDNELNTAMGRLLQRELEVLAAYTSAGGIFTEHEEDWIRQFRGAAAMAAIKSGKEEFKRNENVKMGIEGGRIL